MAVSGICALYVLLGTAMEELSMWTDVIRLAILSAFSILSLGLPSMMKKVDSPSDETLCLFIVVIALIVVITPTQEDTA